MSQRAGFVTSDKKDKLAPVPWRFRIFALDLRSLALARIAAGIVVLGDLLIRGLWIEAFYTENGFSPRSAILDAGFDFLFPWPHLANDTEFYQTGLFLFQGLAAFFLLVGFRTRLFSALTWFGMMSLNARNSMLLNSGDTLLLAYLFWGMFLPWGDAWSWDSRGHESKESTVFSAATVGFCVQVFILYFFAALHKVGPTWLSEGHALYYTFSLEHHTTKWASHMLSLGEYLRPLGWIVVGVEFLLPFVLLSPWKRTRLLGVLAGLGMHWTFGFFLEIGTFRWTPWLGLLGLLPLQSRSHLSADKVSDQLTLTPKSVFLLFVSLLAFAVNIESLGRGKQVLLRREVVRAASLVSANQMWGVFTGESLRENGWFSLEVVVNDGRSLDYWTGKPFQRAKPSLVSGQYPTDRWRKFMMNLPALPPSHPRRVQFARWLLNRWNEQNSEGPGVRLRLWQVSQPTRLGRSPALPVWHLMEEVKS